MIDTFGVVMPKGFAFMLKEIVITFDGHERVCDFFQAFFFYAHKVEEIWRLFSNNLASNLDKPLSMTLLS